ncbi:hypothetical protein E6C76_08665 [Pseudothauera nasutitermitis]|uniref:Lipoprotein n=1 Tax=Pseudothauera nasutitermitis TaxID=2565930 RepID=A0A4S4B0S4_9RHOO|nr:hypothetical protein [Pseudothauera nasutitermitis]THF65632.1 hypothetical protein E6C76_08665 [Pseudothauera nasutitermitis]
MSATRLLATFAAATLLAACSDGGRPDAQLTVPDNPTTRAIAENIRQNDEAAQQRQEAAELERKRQAALPDADLSTPLESYTPLRSGAQLMQLYYAVSGLPVPWERLAGEVSNDYRATSDSFQKQDILQALRPRLEKEIADFAANRYIAFPVRFDVQPYDHERGGFPIHSIAADTSYGFGGSSSRYALSFLNAETFRFARIEDQEQARTIEAERAQRYGRFNATIHAFVRDAVDESGRYMIKGQIARIVVESQDGRIRFEY